MIGILMLNTHFPRLQGDIGNPATFSKPVIYQTIEKALVERVVSDRAVDGSLLNAFFKGAALLEKRGAKVIGTSCGFLASTQAQMAEAVSIPVVTSSLVLVPLIKSLFGSSAKIGVLTFDEAALNARHFNGHLDDNITIQGLSKTGELFNVIRWDKSDLDIRDGNGDALLATDALIARSGGLDAILIECTNISPYKKAIATRSGLPVFDLVDALQWVVTAYQT